MRDLKRRLDVNDRSEILEIELTVKFRITSLDVGIEVPETSAEPKILPGLPEYVCDDLNHGEGAWEPKRQAAR